jgi:hypothetical protein
MGMVNLLVRGEAGVICGCNAIKMKHECSFGVSTLLATVELVPTRLWIIQPFA